jgi:hypothetical protein
LILYLILRQPFAGTVEICLWAMRVNAESVWDGHYFDGHAVLLLTSSAVGFMVEYLIGSLNRMA